MYGNRRDKSASILLDTVSSSVVSLGSAGSEEDMLERALKKAVDRLVSLSQSSPSASSSCDKNEELGKAETEMSSPSCSMDPGMGVSDRGVVEKLASATGSSTISVAYCKILSVFLV